jgi:hypothetical protein
LDNVIRTIPVRDGNGDELILYEYQQSAPHRNTMLGLDRGGGAKRLALDTGEVVQCMDDDNFVIVATGERLTRIK